MPSGPDVAGLGLKLPVLMLVTDRRLAGGEDVLVHAVSEAIAGGVTVVQLREKDLAPAELLPLARRLREVTAGKAVLLVNGPTEIALAVAADGIHLPEAAPMVERPDRPFMVARSVHSREAAEAAWAECNDYLVAGPVFESPSHPGVRGSGPKLIETIAGAVAVPVIAIGGVTAERAEEIMRAGAAGVAVISAVLGSPSPGGAAAALRSALDSAWAERSD
jgi:thiamine-phosphate pyrophosphorylase